MHFIEKEVNRLVKKHKTRDPFELCRLENIQCMFVDMNSEINGMYQYVKRNKFAYINNNLSSRKQAYTCGHELAHAILHPKVNCAFLRNHTYLNTNKLEREADMFLAVLMIPKVTKEMFYERSFDEVTCELDVPKDLLELRLQVARCGGDF